MPKIKVIYILNNASNYREPFFKKLGELVDLTVVSFSGAKNNLKDPEQRVGYRYICLKERTVFGISLQYKEYTEMNGDFDVSILGFNIHHPFRLINLLRRRRTIFSGLIYGRNENLFFTKIARRSLLPLAEGVLVYSNLVKEKLSKEIYNPIISFNNTSFSIDDIKILPFRFSENKLNLIWVGRYQRRKKIERLVNLARRNKNIELRLIGPQIRENINLSKNDSNINIFSEVYGDALTEHFEWSHAVFNTGGAGLLVMNAGRFGRPIFIDNDSFHGPEIQLAKEASQVFIDFNNIEEVDDLVRKCMTDRDYIIERGHKLASVMKECYTVEHMAQQFFKAINGEWR